LRLRPDSQVKMLPYITLLGDARLLLPASVALFFWLRFRGDHKAAAAWLVALAACLALTVVSKLLFYKCGWRVGPYRLNSPSGHASLGITFFGCWVLLAIERDRIFRSLLLVVTTLVFIALLAYSRIALRHHSLAEVLIGSMIGIGCVALFWSLRARPRFPTERLTPLVFGLALGGMMLALWQSNVEPTIRAVAYSYDLSIGLCGIIPLPR
jgi:membrane-associated phospholipid phosphatase